MLTSLLERALRLEPWVSNILSVVNNFLFQQERKKTTFESLCYLVCLVFVSMQPSCYIWHIVAPSEYSTELSQSEREISLRQYQQVGSCPLFLLRNMCSCSCKNIIVKSSRDCLVQPWSDDIMYVLMHAAFAVSVCSWVNT